MSWIPTTPTERDEMLAVIGVKTIEDLFASIPADLRPKSFNLPDALSEYAVRSMMETQAARNAGSAICFLGGGFYDHFIPAAVDALTSRGEFYTAYTPYQPEAAQGTLQAIYEYQSAICRLTGLDFANASLYDGGTAVFEATTMAIRVTDRRRVVVHESVNPRYREMLFTHAANLDLDFCDGDNPGEAACVIVQNPSFRGDVADFSELAEKCHAAGALLVVLFYPISLGLLKTPGEMGADIAIAEGQCLGTPLFFGGPYLGIMAVRKDYVRKMPGRIGAMTQDHEGRRGFVLTLQAREQHIRRGKAMSNICSNEALIALRALIYLSLLGKEGLRDVATQCHAKAQYLKSKLTFAKILNTGTTFNEFAVRLPKNAEDVAAHLLKQGFIAGLPLASLGSGEPNDLLIAVTEKHTRAMLDTFAAALEIACR
ncbi:MAG: putative glycine dehydrogenase (decarboxylating) subunit 1 [Candidatus Hydrogenedentota bacterium]